MSIGFRWTVARSKWDSTVVLHHKDEPYRLMYDDDPKASMFNQFYWLNKEIYFEEFSAEDNKTV